MTLENIKRLMDELNFPVFNAWGYELMLKFYEQAQLEAYEKAAQFVHDNCAYGDTHILVKAIRKLKEEA